MAETKSPARAPGFSLPPAPCLKYFPQATKDFPSLRAAIRQMGLEPKHVEVKRGSWSFSPETLIVDVELSHDHLPPFYRHLLKDVGAELDDNLWAVCRSRVVYSKNTHPFFKWPLKHLVFPWTIVPNGLPMQMHALHLDLQTCKWSLGRGRIPQLTSDI